MTDRTKRKVNGLLLMILACGVILTVMHLHSMRVIQRKVEAEVREVWREYYQELLIEPTPDA